MIDDDEEKDGGDNDEEDENKSFTVKRMMRIDDQIINEAMSRAFYTLLSFTILFVFIALVFEKEFFSNSLRQLEVSL